MKKILVPVDGSNASYRAAVHAAKLAELTKAGLAFLIVRQFVVGRKDVYSVLNDEEARAIRDKIREVAAAETSQQFDIIEEKSRDVAFTIVDIAIAENVDLIVMGASGKGGVKTFLLGSVSQEVLRKSACPVTIVH